jgi:hypothetical protein
MRAGRGGLNLGIEGLILEFGPSDAHAHGARGTLGVAW